jgi:hypothetical protein
MTSRVPEWFDRIRRYRIAAAFLYVPFIATLVGWGFGHELRDVVPMWALRSVYWTGLALLTAALALDAYEVYAGKRQVERMIEKKQGLRKN